ncbi:Xaa-Pro peptidase family protein [Bradyrhizobium sp. SRL28]|uniref:M24 family metallopeptidase n=1 Tax=Bradyrhizobium sp. SRL28 TaxID=2836178 RepID=UPI001BDEBC56|nr:Xaa-Pro peptidase family protein [Bradyrhizobium sp. SRL28]MBT1516783.1 Xaa-Pro peptidase family protein [Bradyrhizobium sp. SRL28]
MPEMIVPDHLVAADLWSDLRRYRDMPEIDMARLYAYRLGRLRGALRKAGASMCVLVSPISLRYAVDFRSFALFQSHIPITYLFVPVEGPIVIHGVYDYLKPPVVDECREGRPISFFGGGYNLPDAARQFADDIASYLTEIGTDNRRVAVEYINPSITQALLQRGLEVIDGVTVSEEARLIKSSDEIACMRWAIGVAELGIAKMKETMRPGVTEVQLWGLLNYTNLANNGDWHDCRMLASGPRINPWFQEASQRKVESGDLVGFDTDMIGPFGYFADISRTFHCGPAKPTKRQKELYRLAMQEIEHNLRLVKPAITFREFQQQALVLPEEYHANAYTCLVHGVGMADEYPRINPVCGKPSPYDGILEQGMVICVESYVGALGERDGVKLEQQVLVVEDGYETLSSYPFEECLLD